MFAWESILGTSAYNIGHNDFVWFIIFFAVTNVCVRAHTSFQCTCLCRLYMCVYMSMFVCVCACVYACVCACACPTVRRNLPQDPRSLLRTFVCISWRLCPKQGRMQHDYSWLALALEGDTWRWRGSFLIPATDETLSLFASCDDWRQALNNLKWKGWGCLWVVIDQLLKQTFDAISLNTDFEKLIPTTIRDITISIR